MKKDMERKLPSFYIALCCCVLAIGVAGFVIQGNEETHTDVAMVAEETDEPYIEPEYDDDTSATDETELPEVAEVIIDPPPAEATFEDYTLDNPDFVDAASVMTAPDTRLFQDPVAEMTFKFGLSTDNLMYNEYYKDWRTHNGIDIAAELGCSVSATADGTVINVAQESYGNTVTIEHNDGFKTVYAQLGEVNVKTGDKVTTGAVIGTVGQSIGENMNESHLHYELLKDGKPVNPQDY